jgi:hypothetical protein
LFSAGKNPFYYSEPSSFLPVLGSSSLACGAGYPTPFHKALALGAFSPALFKPFCLPFFLGPRWSPLGFIHVLFPDID